MKPILRKLAPTSALVVAALGLAAPPAQAQPNTYADIPFQQGSLFYQYNPPNRPRRTVARPRDTVPAQPGSYTVQPQAGRVAAPRPGLTPSPSRAISAMSRSRNGAAARYCNIPPQPGYYYTPTRRGLFGRLLGR